MLRKSHAERTGLLDYNMFGIRDVEKVFGTVFGYIAKVSIGEFDVE
jgi:hypothetical protein